MNSTLMTYAGTCLLTIGVIGGVAAASRTPVHTGMFTIALVLMILGIVLRRAGGKAGISTSHAGDTNTEFSFTALESIVLEVKDLSVELGREKGNGMDILDRIQKLLKEDLPPILSTADHLGVSLGRSKRAEVLSVISEGERSLNRAWSALSDGYRIEAKDSLEKAAEKFREVISMVDSRQESPGSPPY